MGKIKDSTILTLENGTGKSTGKVRKPMAFPKRFRGWSWKIVEEILGHLKLRLQMATAHLL
jgi:hypothetical protein